MIITTGKIIKIEAGLFYFERNSETPGTVSIRCRLTDIVTIGVAHEPVTMMLPTNHQEMETFIAAYRRVCAEEIGYRKSEVEK